MTLRYVSRGAFWGLVAVSVLGLAASLVYYFLPEDGINGSLGVAIVIGSTALMMIASAAIAARFARGWFKWVLAVLILLDILGTGFAAYMLDAYVLLGFMAFAFLVWLFAAFAGPPARQLASAEAAS
jgi:hypothetical protein